MSFSFVERDILWLSINREDEKRRKSDDDEGKKIDDEEKCK
jgi:hypothetical protein